MSNNYTKKSAKNVVASFVLQLSTYFLSFISRSFFIKFLSIDYLGINGLFSNVLTLLSFAELGIGEALVFAMYKPMKENDETKLCLLASLYKKAYRWIAVSILSAGLLISFFIDGLVSEKPNIPENFQLIFCLFILNNVTSYYMVYKQSVLMVDQNKYIISYIRQLIYVIQILLQILFLSFTHNYYIYLMWQIVGTFFTNYCLSKYVDRRYVWVKITPQESALGEKDREKIYTDIKSLSISKISGVIANGSDNIIIAKLINLRSVGLVSNYSIVINSLNSLLWGMLSSITGSIGQFNVDSEIEKKRAVFSELYLCTFWLYSCFCICLVNMLSPFVEVWLGEKFVIDTGTVIILVLIIYVSGLNFPFYSFRVTSGIFEPMKYNYLYSAVLNIAMSILLGKKYGLTGVYAATVISRLIAAEFKEGLIVYRRILDLSTGAYFLKYSCSFGLAFIVCLLTNSWVNKILLTGWSGLFIKTIVCIVLVNLIYVLVFWNTQAFKRLARRIYFLLFT